MRDLAKRWQWAIENQLSTSGRSRSSGRACFIRAVVQNWTAVCGCDAA